MRRMVEPEASREPYRRNIRAYKMLPTVAALTLTGIFLVVFFVSHSYVLALLVAALPTIWLLWRWSRAGRYVDIGGCQNCNQPFPEKMYWVYPPNVCPRCGKST